MLRRADAPGGAMQDDTDRRRSHGWWYTRFAYSRVHMRKRVPRHIVCLTFDFDTQSGFIARGMTTPTPLSRGEFGAIASRRILGLLKSYGIRATWFIPGFTIETWPKECAVVVADGHE